MGDGHMTSHPETTGIDPTPTLLAEILGRMQDHDRAYPGRDYPWVEEPDTVDDLDPEILAGWLVEAERAARVATVLRHRVEALLLVDVGRHGPVRLGDTIYKQGRNTDIRWSDDEAPGRLLHWVADDTETPVEAADRIDKVVRIDARAVRQGEMKALAVIRLERRNPDADEAAMEQAAWAAFDTFFVRAASGTGPEYVLDKIPISRAPKWAQALGHGERRAPRKEQSP